MLETLVGLVRVVRLFVAAGVCEIAGAYLIWH
jgi:drug/metabolite transporter superfamily protein YnfA